MTLVRSQQPVRPSVTIETVLSFYRICADRITAFFSQVQTALLVALCAVLKIKQVAATPTSVTDDVAGKVSRNENSSKMILCSAMNLMLYERYFQTVYAFMFNMEIVLLGLSRKLYHDGKTIGGRFIISKRGRVNRVCSSLWQLRRTHKWSISSNDCR